MAPIKDIGLSVHRFTQIVITVACGVLVYLSQQTYEEVNELGKEMSSVRTSVETHSDQIKELQVDFRELQKDVHLTDKNNH